MMIVFCEECGKKHTIDSEQIKIKAAKFKCASCGNMIVVERRDFESAERGPVAGGLGKTGRSGD